MVLLVGTGVYTIFGGLRAVIFTDLFQAFVLIGGSVLLTVIAVTQAGGFGALTAKVDPSFFSLWLEFDHPDFPWTGILLGAPALHIWYWCTDQMIVQRTLAARNVTDARKATMLAGFLKILPLFILVLPGIAGRVLFPDVLPDRMYATMIGTLLPPGIKGIVIAALLAALMSSLSSVFNSASTLVVMDFYVKRRPQATEATLVRAGEIATGILVFVGLLWLPFIGLISSQLYVYLQSVQAYIAPPITAVFLVGILWKRVNGIGALATLIGGFVLGMGRFVVEVLVKAETVTWGPVVAITKTNFLHYSLFLFLVSLAVLTVVSLLTPPPAADKLRVFDKTDQEAANTRSNTFNVVLVSLLITAVVAIMFYFSPLIFS